MIKAMNPIINGTGYPIFVPNQVLKDKDLNSLVAYLDGQNRLTRTHLIGMGIIGGMTVSSHQTPTPTISIAAGCGITSEGDVIALAATTLTHYQSAVMVPLVLFSGSAAAASTTPSPQYPVVELFEQAGDDRIALPTTLPDFLADQILVVVCETQVEERNACVLDYDDLGQYRNFR